MARYECTMCHGTIDSWQFPQVGEGFDEYEDPCPLCHNYGTLIEIDEEANR